MDWNMKVEFPGHPPHVVKGIARAPFTDDLKIQLPGVNDLIVLRSSDYWPPKTSSNPIPQEERSMDGTARSLKIPELPNSMTEKPQ